MTTNKPLNLFISHISEHKQSAEKLAQNLKRYNIKPFVAHKDIEPTAEWQKELENFLKISECMLAMLHPGYSESTWCNQEVGFGLGREIVLISIKLGEEPKGFIGRAQAYTPQDPMNVELAACEIVNLIQNKAKNSKEIRSWVINSFHSSFSFKATESLCQSIEGLTLTSQEIHEIQTAFMNNFEVRAMHARMRNMLGNEWVDTAWEDLKRP